MPTLIKHFISYANPTGAEPVPNSALMNETQNLTIAVEPGKTYFIRVINMAAFAAQYLWFEGHTVRIVEVDGVWTEEAEANMLYITAAQRYGLLLTTKNDTSKNFAIVGSMDQALFDKVPPALNPNVTSYLVYDKDAELPTPAFVDKFDPFDDFTLVPSDGLELYDHVDYSFNLDVQMDNLGDGANYAFFNGITFVRPKVPVLYSALTTGPNATDPAIYGVNTHAFVLKKNEIIEIVLNNHDPGKHPFHLHGHNFQTVFRSEEKAGDYMHNETLPRVPMRRDVFMVRPNGNMVLRFKADNPDKSPCQPLPVP
jgi:iron transport multicopper oxidase